MQAGGRVGQDGSNRWKGWYGPGGSLMDKDILVPCARLTSRCPSAPGSDAHLDISTRGADPEGGRAAVHPRVDIPPRKGIARRGAGRLGAEGARVRPGGAMGKGYIARG